MKLTLPCSKLNRSCTIYLFPLGTSLCTGTAVQLYACNMVRYHYQLYRILYSQHRHGRAWPGTRSALCFLRLSALCLGHPNTEVRVLPCVDRIDCGVHATSRFDRIRAACITAAVHSKYEWTLQQSVCVHDYWWSVVDALKQ